MHLNVADGIICLLVPTDFPISNILICYSLKNIQISSDNKTFFEFSITTFTAILAFFSSEVNILLF